MGCRRNRIKKLLISVVTLYFMMSIFTVPVVSANSDATTDNWIGPYLDKIRYVYINGSDPNNEFDDFSAPVQPLIDGEIDVMTTQLHVMEEIDTLRKAQNVKLVEFWRSGGYDATINCGRWPLNISGVRKAFHLALDKNTICAMQGGRPHDSPIISPLSFSIESEMEHHYYEAEVEAGNAILDSLGFLDIDSDGWREGPREEEIPSINIEYYRAESQGPLNEDAADEMVEAFEQLGIHAYKTRSYGPFDVLVERVSTFPLDFDILLIALTIHDMTLDNFINYWLSRADWSNATFEALADVALHSTDLAEVTDALKQMQYIWVEEAPTIMHQQLSLGSAYRTDTFDGIIEHASYGPHSFFTGLNARNASDAAGGGTIRFGTTNTFGGSHEEIRLPTYTCAIEESNWFSVKNHMELMYDSLAMIDPELNVVNWLAEEYMIETHDDDPAIPDGHTRILVDLVENAKFSDGARLTAEDVVHSILWFTENFALEIKPSDIARCYGRSAFQVEFQFTTESFWHWYKICFIPIIPFHALDQYDRLSSSGFRLTPEDFNENLVVSGPFMASEWVLSEYIDIVPNPYYWKKPPKTTPITSTPITTTRPPPSPFLPIIAGIAGAATVITVGGFVILRKD
jgi:ABC-type transport system substrate-binding protein